MSHKNMRHKLSILAYEMNGEPLNYLHGAPLRLRCENQLGFKMVKWIQAIKLVDDFTHLGRVMEATTKIMSFMEITCRFETWVHGFDKNKSAALIRLN